MPFEILVNLGIFLQFEEFAADFNGDDFRLGELWRKAFLWKFTAFLDDLHNVNYQTRGQK